MTPEEQPFLNYVACVASVGLTMAEIGMKMDQNPMSAALGLFSQALRVATEDAMTAKYGPARPGEISDVLVKSSLMKRDALIKALDEVMAPLYAKQNN